MSPSRQDTVALPAARIAVEFHRACPFCACASCVSLCITPGMHIIVCTSCRAQGPLAPTVEEAWDAWGWRGEHPWRVCLACQRWFRVMRTEQECCNGNCARRLRTWRRKRAEVALLAQAEQIVRRTP